MSDSPKCSACYAKGQLHQLYKIAGKPLFNCNHCGNNFEKSSFEPIEFEWRNPAKVGEYREFMEKKKGAKLAN